MTPAEDLGPESVLQDAEGTPATEVRDRLGLALRYIANWYKATRESDDRATWWAKIDACRVKVEEAFAAMDPTKVFPGNAELAVYHEAQLAFPALWRELTLSVDTLPHPDLIDKAASYLETLVQLPQIVIPDIGDWLARLVGGTLGRILEQLWPWLALAGGGVFLYLLVKSGAAERAIGGLA